MEREGWGDEEGLPAPFDPPPQTLPELGRALCQAIGPRTSFSLHLLNARQLHDDPETHKALKGRLPIKNAPV